MALGQELKNIILRVLGDNPDMGWKVINILNEVDAGVFATTDISATGDLTVGDDAVIGGDLAVTTSLAVAGSALVANASSVVMGSAWTFTVDQFTMDGGGSGDTTILVGDNRADALTLSIAGGGSAIWTVVTTNSSESFHVATRLTTADGVASGTARVVGGRCTANVSAADSVTAAASNNAFVSFASTYSIPADTIKVGTIVRIRALVRVSNASGTDTLTVNLRLGTTSLIATTAVDPGATTDLHILEFELTGRAAPGAAASIVGSGRWITNTGGTIAHGTGLLGATNFATNGALVIDSQAKWSSNTANTACLLESLVVEIT